MSAGSGRLEIWVWTFGERVLYIHVVACSWTVAAYWFCFVTLSITKCPSH